MNLHAVLMMSAAQLTFASAKADMELKTSCLLQQKKQVFADTLREYGADVDVQAESEAASPCTRICTDTVDGKVCIEKGDCEASMEGVLVQLDTGDETNRDWGDSFWTDTAPLNVGGSSRDIRTAAYSQGVLGEWIILEFIPQGHTSPTAEAHYAVLPEFQQKSLRQLLSCELGDNKVFTSNKDASRSKGSTANADPFFDGNNPLIACSKSWCRSQGAWSRLSTTEGCKAPHLGHGVMGIGGIHKHNGWCLDFEMMPNMGYCPRGASSNNKELYYNTEPSFGRANSQFGGCSHWVWGPKNGDQCTGLSTRTTPKLLIKSEA